MFSLHRAAVAVCLVVLAVTSAKAQFPVTLNLPATSGTPVVTPPTRADARYRITVSGTYSQWPQFSDCHGVDAVWVYDVPQEEIDALRWPPKTFMGRPFVEIPHWVGDSTVYGFPPSNLGIPPLFELSFRKYLGFRVNGEPLPPLPLDPTFHRYQHVMSGTGSAISFMIVDSTYNISQGAVIPRYEDNCGGLTIVVEEILNTDINICKAAVVKSGNQVVGLRIDASIVTLDSTTLGGTRNVLATKEQLGIVADGKFICPDSLVCDTARTQPISICLVVDVSGSMDELIPYGTEFIDRLTAVKRSIHDFMRRLKPGDSLSLIQFNQTVRLTQNWTADTSLVGKAVDRLIAGGNTSFYRAIITGCRMLATHARTNKALVALTDGLDNDSATFSADVLREIRAANVPIYLMALGFIGEPGEVQALDTMQQFVAAAPSGKVYQVTTGSELQDVYKLVAENFAKDECCRLYFNIPPCDKGQRKRVVSLVFVEGNTILSKRLEVDCDLKTTSVANERTNANDPDVLDAIPTPSDDEAILDVVFARPGQTITEVYSLDGILQLRIDHGHADTGKRRLAIPTSALAGGAYVGRVMHGTDIRTYRIVVRH
ncbi:MAG: VWA domain-containing protein [Candidatus Kapabacteria bacterium]|nr:VWA domain-containing protein [Candidatus Kapabacteria bacterium]